MPRRILMLAVLSALPACGDAMSPMERPSIVKTTVIFLSPSGTREEKVQDVDCFTLSGAYVLGDGEGYNLRLTLKREGEFDCTWRGCLGDYGSTVGEWRLDKNGLKLSTKKSEGMLKDWPLSPLTIISIEDHYLLVRENDRKSFEERGPNHIHCFHKQEADKLLEKAEERSLEQQARKAEGLSGP